MASKQYEDKGARPKTFPSQGGGSTSTQNVSEHQCNSQESVLESDVVPDAIPVFLDIVDVVVIYSKEDYEVASDKFIPWLKDRAMGINEPDARIYLYDDISVDINLFRKTEDMATRCMKILVYITEHFMANTELKSIVEELIFLTKFGNAEEAKQHISNIYKLGSDIGIETNPLDSLTECVLQQKKSALMPVQTTEKKIGFTGLLAIHPIIQFFAVEQNKKCKENIASNVIRAAINDRRKYQQGQQNATCQRQRQQNLQASYHSHMLHVSQMERNPQPCRSTRHEHMTDFGNQHSTSDQFILENQVTNEAVSFDSTVEFPSPTSQPMNSQVPSPSAINENQEGRDVEPSSDGLPASSKTVIEGINSRGTSLEDNAPKDNPRSGLNVSEQNAESDLAGYNNQQHAHKTSENAEPVGAEAAEPNEDILSDLETDRTKSSKHCDSIMTESGYQSRCNSLTEVKTPRLSDGRNKPENDSGEESLEDKSLVNDFGEAANDSSEAALKNKNQIPQKNDDQLCTDAATCGSKPNNAGSDLVNDSGTEAVHLNAPHEKLKTKDNADHESEVMEHTVTYTGRGRPVGRGVMAGNSPSKGELDGSPPINPPPYRKDNPVGSSQNQLLNLLTGADQIPILTVHHVHHYEPPQPPTESKRAAAEVPSTINVYGANSVVIGKHSKAILTDSTMMSNTSLDTSEKDNPGPKNRAEKDTGKKMDDVGEDAATPSTESFNDLSSYTPSSYNFPMSAKAATKELKTDSDKVDKTAHQNEETKIFDDNNSSDEDNSVKDSSPVSTAAAHRGYESNHSPSEQDFDHPMKKTNLTDTKGLKENKSHITAEGYESNHSPSEQDFDHPMKKTNLTDTKGLKENKSHITAEGYESNHSPSEQDFDHPMKKTNLTDTKGLKENKSHITAEDDLPSSIGNQSWQSEAELVLGPPMDNDFESLVEEERSVNPNLENSNNPEDTGIGSVNITVDSEAATPPIQSGGAEYQCGAETGNLQFVSQQPTSLFSSVCITKNFAQRCLRTNALGLMVQTWDSPQSEKQVPKIQDNDVD